jgi:hypothetical protein
MNILVSILESDSDSDDEYSDKRRVSFSNINTLELIETRMEMSKDDIWYTKLHFQSFRLDAIEELQQHMRLHGISRADEALTSLYQPNHYLPERLSPSQSSESLNEAIEVQLIPS